MQPIKTYNHQKPKDDPNRVSFFYTAAKISLLGPVLCAILARGATYGLKDMHIPGLVVYLGGFTVLVNVISFVLGLVALFGMFRYGMSGLMVRAVLGLLLSGLSLGCFGAGFVRGFQAALKQHQLTARARTTSGESDKNSDNGVDSANDINPPGTLPPPESTGSGKTKSSPINASVAKSRPADTSVAGQALASFEAQQRTLIASYDAAALAIKTPPVLSMSGVTNREQLLERKKLVTKFMDANEKWLGFSTKAEVTLRDEMIKLRANTATVDAGLKEYRDASGDRDFLVMQLRATDQRIGSASLNMLTLLEANWGSWKYDAQKNRLSFGNSTVAGQYNDSLADLNDAGAEQSRLQTALSRKSDSASAPAKPSL